jgi:hypothetical protein
MQRKQSDDCRRPCRWQDPVHCKIEHGSKSPLIAPDQQQFREGDHSLTGDQAITCNLGYRTA